MFTRKFLLFLISIGFVGPIFSQNNPDVIYDSAIHTVRVHPANAPLAMPIISLNELRPLQISFDDFNANYQDYYYSVELMSAQWTAVQLSPFDYLQGFNQIKINEYSVSSIATQRYFHYQFSFPNANCKPKQSGNYIIKVYKNGNTSEVIFTSRFYVVDNQVAIAATVQSPFDGTISRTHQQIKAIADVKKIPYLQPDQIKLQVIQNFNYNDAQTIDAPTFIRDNKLEYNREGQFVFPAGKEARWLDLRSLRLASDRIFKFESINNQTIVYLKPDISRADMAYYTFNDLNGNYMISNSESLESDYQNDYAKVVFTYMPSGKLPFVGQNLYLQGALTNNLLDQKALMVFNAKLGLYQKTLLLKQGYYSYNYVLRESSAAKENTADVIVAMDDYTETEGNHWETENNYTLFLYYRAPGARNDQIIGHVTFSSTQSW
jgi:hypothetical protein